MFIIVNYRAELSGSAEKRVTCERCGCGFAYAMTRVGVGQDGAAYNIGAQSAQAKAARAAERDLAKRLGKDHDAVPCPRCGHVQAEMIRSVRRKSYLRLWKMYVGFFLIGGILTGIGVAGILLNPQGLGNRDVLNFLSAGGVVSMPGVLLFALRSWLNRLYDPNNQADSGQRMIDPRVLRADDPQDLELP